MKLVKGNRRLHVLRSLRKEQYSQVEIEHLFKLVLPNFIYCFSVYGASESHLNIIKLFVGSLPQAPLCFFSSFY